MPQPTTDADLNGAVAVVTGGADGMGRSLTTLLTSLGVDVATCDINEAGLAGTAAAAAGHPGRCTTFVADVTDEAALEQFRKETLATFEADAINLAFLNAGIAGGGSMFSSGRDAWERVFDICWRGVYLGARVFLPSLAEAEWGRIVNTSSVNGFWASLGPGVPHTAYSAAKFAVKGFTEALMTDLEMHAPTVEASVVMPGHIGTGIAENTFAQLNESGEQDQVMAALAQEFRTSAPTSSDQAARIILDGVLAREWRILVGRDAQRLDEAVRADPANAYTVEFAAALAAAREADRP